MIPVPQSELIPYNIAHEKDLQYKSIVSKEYAFIKANLSMILKNASVIYKQKINEQKLFIDKPVPNYLQNTVDFLYAESKCKEYIVLLEHQKSAAKKPMEAAWNYIKKLRTYDNIEAGLITIAENKLKKHYRKHPACIPIEELAHVASPDKSLDEIVIAAETGAKMRELFRTLDKNQVRIVLLHNYYNLSLKQIADMYGHNYNTVLSWHNRAIKKLQENCMKNEDF